MIWHKAVSPDLEAVERGVSPEPLEIAQAVVRRLEDGPAEPTALDDVVRVAGKDGTG